MEIRRSKRLLGGLAILCGGCCIFLVYKSLVADEVGRFMALLGAALTTAVWVPCVVMLVRNSVVGLIDNSGIFLKSWGVGLIPWRDIASFSVDVDGEGGRLISIHLHDEDAYLSKMSSLKASVCKLRKLIGFSPIVIFLANIDLPLEAVVQKLKNHVPERPA